MANTKISALTAATTPLVGSEVLPIVQSGATVKVSNNDLRPKQIQSNSTSGVLQIDGPAAASTRVMTTPNANFTVARTDAAQTFTGAQTFTSTQTVTSTSVTAASFTGASTAIPGTAGFWNNTVAGLELYDSVGTAGYGVGLRLRPNNGGTYPVAGFAALAPSTTTSDLVFHAQSANGSVPEDLRIAGSTGNVSVNLGNIVIGTSGKGITDSTGGLTSTYNSTGITTNGTNSAGQVYRVGTYTAGATTPSVLGVSHMVIANSSPTTITNFTNAVNGQILTLIFSDSNTTFTRFNAFLSLGLNFTSTASDTLTLISNGGVWYEVSRSVNS
jgi:hypothetical protein